MSSSKSVIIDRHPGRSSQTIGIARELGTDIDLIHEPSVGVVGNKGDSQCYLGVQRKVEAIHDALRAKIGQWRAPDARCGWCSRNTRSPPPTACATARKRDALFADRARGHPGHALRASERQRSGRHHRRRRLRQAPGRHAVRAAGAHDRPGHHHVRRPDPPGYGSGTNETLDIVAAFQVAGSDDEDFKIPHRLPCLPRLWLCGGMFTYNTMQTFIGVVGMQPLDMVAPPPTIRAGCVNSRRCWSAYLQR